ncbi:hypothetical protein JCM5353_006776 [Sporobolomyces roseus]
MASSSPQTSLLYKKDETATREEVEIPAEIRWCYAQLKETAQSRSFSLEDVETKGGSEIRKQVEKLSQQWRSSTGSSKGDMSDVSGILEEAIAGWKLEELDKKEENRPSPSSTRSSPPSQAHENPLLGGVFFTPLVTSDGRFVYM